MNRKLILIRHATTTAPPHTFLGSGNDYPLSSSGKKDARYLAEFVSITNPSTRFFTSSLARARETSEILFPKTICQVDDRLNEVNFGSWSGLTIEKISEGYPEELSKWGEDPMNFKFPQGESVKEFIKRINDFLDEIPRRTTGNYVLICHGGVIRFIICSMLKIPYSHHLAFEIRRPSINVIDHDGKYGVLSGLNLSEFYFK